MKNFLIIGLIFLFVVACGKETVTTRDKQVDNIVILTSQTLNGESCNNCAEVSMTKTTLDVTIDNIPNCVYSNFTLVLKSGSFLTLKNGEGVSIERLGSTNDESNCNLDFSNMIFGKQNNKYLMSIGSLIFIFE